MKNEDYTPKTETETEKVFLIFELQKNDMIQSMTGFGKGLCNYQPKK
jgi:hypothetical protein